MLEDICLKTGGEVGMIDREKVIKGLEHCANEADCRGCVYQEQMKGRFDGCDCMREALTLLKEQEPVKPTYEDFFGNRIARCGKCNGYIVRYKYCPGCGKAVKWE